MTHQDKGQEGSEGSGGGGTGPRTGWNNHRELAAGAAKTNQKNAALMLLLAAARGGKRTSACRCCWCAWIMIAVGRWPCRRLVGCSLVAQGERRERKKKKKTAWFFLKCEGRVMTICLTCLMHEGFVT